MEQFLAIALAHVLALLVPGVDFVVIVRTALTRGAATAARVCLGIALAHAGIITLAFTGVSAVRHPAVLTAIQLGGAVFLAWMAVMIWRSATQSPTAMDDTGEDGGRARGPLLTGVAVAALNPKNLLFYVALSAATATAAPLLRIGYAAWMVAVVLGWDLLLALVLGRGRGMDRLRRRLPWLNRAAAIVLLAVGLGMIGRVGATLTG